MPRKPAPVATLTPQQEQFVHHYLLTLNATKAAIAAGYSAKTAAVQGWDLLRRPHIAAAIEARQTKAAAKAEVELDRLVLEAYRIALADISQAFDKDGNLLPIHEMPEDVRRAIAGVDVVISNAKAGDGKTDVIHKVRFWDKGRAIELAGKMSGKYVEKREVGKPGQFRKLTDEEVRAKLREAQEVFGIDPAPPRVM